MYSVWHGCTINFSYFILFYSNGDSNRFQLVVCLLMITNLPPWCVQWKPVNACSSVHTLSEVLSPVIEALAGLTHAHTCTHTTSAQTVPQCLQTSGLQMAGSLTLVITRRADRTGRADRPAACRHDAALSVCHSNNLCLHWLQPVTWI